MQKGRIQPGRMFLVNTAEKRIVSDDEIKSKFAREKPYAEWMKAQSVQLKDVPAGQPLATPDHDTLELRQRVFGYTTEDIRLIQPMAETGLEPIGFHGDGHALGDVCRIARRACSITSSSSLCPGHQPAGRRHTRRVDHVGGHLHRTPSATCVDPQPESAHQIDLDSPVLFNDDHCEVEGFGRLARFPQPYPLDRI